MFKEYREKLGLTQDELHKIAKVSTTTISNIENEKCIPTIATTSKLFKALNVSDDDIYEYLMLYLDYNKINS